MNIAWGVEIKEGPNMRVFSLLSLAALLLSGVAAAVFTVLTKDLQSGITFGAWPSTIQDIVLAMQYNRWVERTL